MTENLSIEQLENDFWSDTTFPSELVRRCYEYRKVPIKDLSVEQLRTLLSQNIGVKYILSKVVSLLRENILAEGDFYPGDLLSAVLSLDKEAWISNQKIKDELVIAIKAQMTILDEENSSRSLSQQIEKFMAI